MSFYAPTNQPPALRMPAPEQAAPRIGNLGAVLARLEEAVDEETSAIRTDIHFDIKASNARKSRHLYELTRAMKGAGEADFLAEHSEGLKRLREKLANNQAAILAHLHAVSEVATLMQNAIQSSEADGTYSSGEFGWAR